MLKRLAIGSGILLIATTAITIFAIFFGGRIRYNMFFSKWERRGVTFKIPTPATPIPKGQDFREAPGIVDWIGYDGTGNRPKPEVYTRFLDAKLGIDFDIDVDKNQIAQPEVVISAATLKRVAEKLRETHPIKDQLYEAVHRPHATQKSLIMMGQINEFYKSMGRHAYSEVLVGDHESAVRDFTTTLRFPEKIHQSCGSGLVATLIEVAALGIISEYMWASLQQDTWDREGLTVLENECRRIQIHKNLPKRMISEIAWNKHDIFGNGQVSITDPKEWISENLVMQHLATSYNFLAETMIWDHNKKIVATELTPEMSSLVVEKEMKLKHMPNLVRELTCVTVPNLGRIGDAIIDAQQRLDMVALTCRLKRYYLENGEYPDSLHELSIALPRDYYQTSSNATLIYERRKSGQFTLHTANKEVAWMVGNVKLVDLEQKRQHDLESWKAEFDNIEMSEEFRESLEEVIRQAEGS